MPLSKGTIASLYTSVKVGCIIKKVRTSESPIRIWFGGTVCVLKAALVKWSTIMILVKEVIIKMIVGRTAISVSASRILNSPAMVPLLLLTVIVAVLAIFSSVSSSDVSASPGSCRVVLLAVSPVSPRSTSNAVA